MIQGISIRLFPGLVNFVLAVAYLFSLNLTTAFLQLGNGLILILCTVLYSHLFLGYPLWPVLIQLRMSHEIGPKDREKMKEEGGGVGWNGFSPRKPFATLPSLPFSNCLFGPFVSLKIEERCTAPFLSFMSACASGDSMFYYREIFFHNFAPIVHRRCSF